MLDLSMRFYRGFESTLFAYTLSYLALAIIVVVTTVGSQIIPHTKWNLSQNINTVKLYVHKAQLELEPTLFLNKHNYSICQIH